MRSTRLSLFTVLDSGTRPLVSWEPCSEHNPRNQQRHWHGSSDAPGGGSAAIDGRARRHPLLDVAWAAGCAPPGPQRRVLPEPRAALLRAARMGKLSQGAHRPSGKGVERQRVRVRRSGAVPRYWAGPRRDARRPLRLATTWHVAPGHRPDAAAIELLRPDHRTR